MCSSDLTTPLTLTNEYSWQYGGYPFTNTPGSAPEHFFDEVHRLFSTTYPANTTFTLQIDSEDTASSYTINLADFEDVGPALTQPAGWASGAATFSKSAKSIVYEDAVSSESICSLKVVPAG